MRWYFPVAPRPDLAELVACSWTAEPTGTHRLVPDGCIDLLWRSPGYLMVCGPETEAWTFSLPTGTTAVGVRFRPGAAPAVFGFEPWRIRNKRVDLAPMLGQGEADRLANDIAETVGLDEQRACLESFVAELVVGRTIEMDFADTVVDFVVANGQAGLAEVANAVGLTVRQLHRRSLKSFGYGTKTLSRLVRFQRFLAIVETGFDRTLAQAAADAGYSDHAHLTRDCGAITRLAPTHFLGEYFPTFPNMSDPFKTDVPLTGSIGP